MKILIMKNSDQPDSNCCEEVQRNRSFRKYCTQLTAKAEAAGNQLYLDTTEPIDVCRL